MEGKPWYQSKTMWANGLAAIAAVLAVFGFVEIGVEEQAAIVAGIMAIVNIVLRVVTKEPVTGGS